MTLDEAKAALEAALPCDRNDELGIRCAPIAADGLIAAHDARCRAAVRTAVQLLIERLIQDRGFFETAWGAADERAEKAETKNKELRESLFVATKELLARVAERDAALEKLAVVEETMTHMVESHDERVAERDAALAERQDAIVGGAILEKKLADAEALLKFVIDGIDEVEKGDIGWVAFGRAVRARLGGACAKLEEK